MITDLFEGNRAWAAARVEADPGYFGRLAAQQRPRYLWIGCADSRVPANVICGLDPGEIFVQRNVANLVHQADLNLLTVLDFAINVLDIRTVILCGHYGCAGVRTSLRKERSGLADHWVQPIREVANAHRAELQALDPAVRLDRLTELNVQAQVRELAACPIVVEAWRRGATLEIHGLVYGLEDGLLRDLGCVAAAPTIDGPDASDLLR